MTNAATAGSQSNARGIAGVLFAGTVWGTTGTAATFAPDVSAAAIGAAAMGIGGLGQALLALRGMAHARAQLWQHRGLLLLGALAVMIYPLAFYGAMRLAGVTIGTVVTIGTAPLFAALIEYVMERSKLTLRWTVGALSGVAGMVLICLAEGSSHGAVGGSSVPLGVALGLLGGFTYALYSWTARAVMLRGVRSSVVMGATFGLGGILLMPVLIVTGGPLLASWGNAAVGLYMAFVPMFLGYICFGYGLSRVRASTATTLTLIEPVVAAVLAVVIVGERLPALGWTGVGLVVMCLLVLTMPMGHRAQTVPPIPSK